jgi:transposase InsO family protein
LFRYQLICPALDPGLSTKARGRVVRAIAARTHTGPFGGEHRYCRDTLDRWIRRYRAGGLDALAPTTRQPGSRIDTTVLELAVALKRENPQRTAAQVARILRASSGWAPSESTLLRLFHRHDLMGPAAGGEPAVFGRFEAATPNERWVGDALHGPKIAGRKTYLFAFIDDHSRLAVGYRFGFAEDTVRLAAALQPALAARGVPGSVYVDYADVLVMPTSGRWCWLVGGSAGWSVGIIRGSSRLGGGHSRPTTVGDHLVRMCHRTSTRLCGSRRWWWWCVFGWDSRWVACQL